MCQKTEIAQTSGFGSHDNTFIGEQHNHGLSVSDATQMAFAIFREYYPQLRDEALKELNILLTEKMHSVPQDQIIPPKARIAVPTLQYASITDEQEVRELYASLLANSMNSVTCNSVHPSYVEIIKQLSQDDAKLIHYMSYNGIIPIISLHFPLKGGGGGKILDDFTNVPELLGCANFKSIDGCFKNLIRLGLVNRYFHGLGFSDDVRKRLIEHPFFQEKYKEAQNTTKELKCSLKIEEHMGFIMFTDFGRDFSKVCVIEKKEENNHDKL